MKLIVSVGLCILVLTSCTSGQEVKDAGTYIMEIDYLGGDTCIKLKKDSVPFSAFRTLEILENSISDSIKLGFSVIPGGFKGKVGYFMDGDSLEGMLYASSFEETNLLPKTDRIWIFPFHKIQARGKIKIKFLL